MRHRAVGASGVGESGRATAARLWDSCGHCRACVDVSRNEAGRNEVR